MTKNKPAPKTARRRGEKRTPFYLYLTSAAEQALGQIPNGQKAKFINDAIVLAANPTKQKQDN